jgi:hypothetical protein
MGPDVTLPTFAVVLIFLGGVIVGWLFATMRARGVVDMTAPAAPQKNEISQLLAAMPSSTTTTKTIFRVNKNVVRTMNFKCKCGAESKFSDHPNPAAGVQPFPESDSFVCAKCGATQNLGDLQHLIDEALAK